MIVLIDKQQIQISIQTHCGHRWDAGGGGDLTKPIGEALNLIQARPRHGDMGGLGQDDVTRKLVTERIPQFLRLIF